MHGRQWRPTAPAVKYDKSSFSFLIAFGRQLELALELESDGSAPDFVSDALGVLANGMDGLTGEHLDAEDAGGSDDDGSDDDDGAAGRVRHPVASRDTRLDRGGRAVGGAVRGLSPNDMKTIHMDAVPMRGTKVPKAPKPGSVPRGTRAKKGGKRRAAKK